MKILFFVPTHIDAVDIHHELTTRLAHCLSDNVEVTIVTSGERNASSMLSECDVLHIFGCWTNSAYTIADKAYYTCKPYVITPLGGLQPWEIERRNMRTFTLHRQHQTVQRAAAINVCGKLEMQTFDRLAWNRNVCLIKNPVLTSQTTFDDVVEEYLRLYRKVLDSNARLLIGDDAKTAIGMLLQLGVDPQGFEYVKDKDTLLSTLNKLTEEDWRKIFIYSVDEHIDVHVKQALETLHFEYPQIDVASIDRFDAKSNYPEDALNDDALLSRNLIVRNKVKETFANRGIKEQGVCLQIMNFQYELNRHSEPLSHLVDIYLAMRFTDMDEDMVADMLKELGLTDFTRKLLAVMSELFGLTEGFMPLTPERRRKVRRLTKEITKFGTYK